MKKWTFLCNVIFSLILVSGCSTTDYYQPQQSIKLTLNEFKLDSYNGEWIPLVNAKSANVQNLNLSLVLPENYKLLNSAGPYARIFTEDFTVDIIQPITDLNESYSIGQMIVADDLFVLLKIFYCQEEGEGLCITKDVLFEVILDSSLPAADLHINYLVPGEK